MKLNFLCKILDVLSFKISSKSKKLIILSKSNKNILTYDFNGKILWRLNDKVFNYFLKDNYFIMVSNYDSVQYLIDIDLGIRVDLDNFKLLDGVFDDIIIENKVLIINRNLLIIGIIDLVSKQLVWKKKFEDFNEKILTSSLIISWKYDKIIMIDFEGNIPLFEYSVSELGKRKWVNGSETIEEDGAVSKIIGVMGEVLVVVITGGGDRDRARTQLIGLHTQTGELCWLLDGFEHEGITYPHLPTTATLMPDAQNEFLVGFQNRYFIEIDPQMGKVTRCRKIDDQCQIHNLATIMDSFSLQGDYLYFRTSVSSMGGFPTAIGAFNYKTEEIEWLHVFEEGKFIPINQPKVEGNRVYALDSGSTLHIFERE